LVYKEEEPMPRWTLRAAFAAATLMSIWNADSGVVRAQQPGTLLATANPLGATAPGAPMPLFYNYYVGPPGVPAQIYPGPRPTPAFVGQVWITYPPLMPHEFLYHHKRSYYKYTPGGYSSCTVRYH
jgi:hypothetical protein